MKTFLMFNSEAESWSNGIAANSTEMLKIFEDKVLIE